MQDSSRIIQYVDQTILYTIIALIIFTPLPFGSVQVWAVRAIEIVIFILGILWCFKLMLTKEFSITVTPLVWALLFFIGIVIIQVIPLPIQIVKILSPNALPGAHTISFYPFQTLQELWKVIAYTTFYLLIVNQRDKSFFNKMIYVVLWIGFSEAVYGLYQKASGTQKIFGLENPNGAGWAFGTFVNPSHYAGFLQMIFPTGLGLFFSRMHAVAKRAKSWRSFVFEAFSEKKISTVWFLFMSLVMVISLFLSGAKGAIISILVSILYFIIAAIFFYGSGIPRRISIIFFVFLSACFIWLAREQIHKQIPRFSFENIEHDIRGPQSRGNIWMDSFSMASDYSMLGIGLGNYVFLFPKYQYHTVLSKGYYVDHAHNEYLEVLCETGLIGILVLVVGVVVTLLRAFLSKNLLTLGLLTGLMSLSIDNFTEFNLRIPANVLMCLTLFGLLNLNSEDVRIETKQLGWNGH